MTEKQQIGETTFIMIDDNPVDLKFNRIRMRMAGVINKVFTESNPENIIGMLDHLVEMGLNKDTFLILLDLHMPRVNGLEALESIRNHPKYKNTPVLMFSSSTDADDIIRAFDAGSDGYLEKPFSGEEFFSAIGNISKFKKLLLQELN